MNAKSKSAYGLSFFIRIGVLLFLLVVVGGAFAYDRFVLVPAGEQGVDRIINACPTTGNVERAAVLKAAGCEPTSTETAGRYQIDDWTFGRILPNLAGHKVTVLYLNGQVTETIRGGISDEDREALKE